MNDVIYISSGNPDETVVKWNFENDQYSFDSEINFGDAIVFLGLKRVIVFHARDSSECSYVGILFDLWGKEIGKIPFPNPVIKLGDLKLVYKWSIEIDEGVKIIFGTNSINYRDFWCDFEFGRFSYTKTGESR